MYNLHCNIQWHLSVHLCIGDFFMKKNKTKTKGIIFLLIFLVLILSLSAFILVKAVVVSKNNLAEVSSTYETIMAFDYENNYPTEAEEVMDDYCYIISYLYSDEILDEEIPSVVEKARELLHFKTTENTTLDEQVEEVKKERETIASTDSFVTNATHSNVVIDSQFPNYADCSVTEYTESDNTLLGDYVLEMDNYQWKIYSWTLKGTSTRDGK